MDDPFSAGIALDPKKYYFLYIGEIKAIDLNRFMRGPVEIRSGKPADFIAVVPDVLSRYPEGNTIVVNSAAREARERSGLLHNIRITAGRFAEEVSRDRRVLALVDRLIDAQGELFVNMFESRPELAFADGRKVKILGPAPDLALTFNSKLTQYGMAIQLGIPVPSGGISRSLDEAVGIAEGFFSNGQRAFVSEEYSAAGANSIVASNAAEIRVRFKGTNGHLLVTHFVDHEYDPTVLGIIAGPEDVYIASVADQNIEGTRFKGSTYPTVLSSRCVEDLKEMTRALGHHLGGLGYRGAFGCDYIVDQSGRIYFIEINARKQGTTMETTLTMKHHLPGHPYFPELEFYAVVDGKFPDGVLEMDSRREGLCWGTYNFKVSRDVVVTADLPLPMDQPEFFARAANGSIEENYIVMDYVGAGVRLHSGGFLGRVIAASSSPEKMREALKEGVERVAETCGDILL
ncbi:MAG: ATP-grasp domain-containing protein [Deltaproteobacteria bacterium]|nr:ATP-grasp domain-containing protein [Deltaproteobacteria bacterium]